MPVPPSLRLSLREPTSGRERLGYQLAGRGRALGKIHVEGGTEGGREGKVNYRQRSLLFTNSTLSHNACEC